MPVSENFANHGILLFEVLDDGVAPRSIHPTIAMTRMCHGFRRMAEVVDRRVKDVERIYAGRQRPRCHPGLSLTSST
jgi:hypothetical protein